MKGFQLNPNTRLSGKTKELIGLAVAAQIPCQYCIYFHTVAAKANGATDEEIKEAVAMAAVTRHWSTVLNGMQIDLGAFKRDTDTVLNLAAEKAKAASKSQ
ncbi:MAG: carboxymuconolactone decarboxylase family protein [Methylobacteriaceae bacterium]|nr:carboxymuconolactone decarboxylase family protein [Methylobacteriaceae bacterium]